MSAPGTKRTVRRMSAMSELPTFDFPTLRGILVFKIMAGQKDEVVGLTKWYTSRDDFLGHRRPFKTLCQSFEIKVYFQPSVRPSVSKQHGDFNLS